MNKIQKKPFTNVPIANIKIQILNQTKKETAFVKNVAVFYPKRRNMNAKAVNTKISIPSKTRMGIIFVKIVDRPLTLR